MPGYRRAPAGLADPCIPRRDHTIPTWSRKGESASWPGGFFCLPAGVASDSVRRVESDHPVGFDQGTDPHHHYGVPGHSADGSGFG
jgi:hypothetical protein